MANKHTTNSFSFGKNGVTASSKEITKLPVEFPIKAAQPGKSPIPPPPPISVNNFFLKKKQQNNTSITQSKLQLLNVKFIYEKEDGYSHDTPSIFLPQSVNQDNEFLERKLEKYFAKKTALPRSR